MRSTLGAVAAAFAVAFVLAGCGAAPVARTAGSPLPQVSASPTTDFPASPDPTTASPTPDVTPPGFILPSPSPSADPCSTYEPLPGLCVGVIGRVPTKVEFAGMLAAGAPAIEKALGMKDWSVCSNGQACFKAGPAAAAMVGTNAAVFDGEYGLYPGGGLGAACWVFVYHDTSGWHYLNSGCAQNPGFVPGSSDTGTHVFVTGCANFRATPALTGKVLGCLGNRTIVNVDSAPVYQDGHIWWHLTGRGWMAHDYLCEICRT
jgi:hypothetical protein